MEKSYKNILQEYCQKNNINLPKYETIKIGTTEDNLIIWKSTVTIKDLQCESIDHVKKNAEQKAALLMYTSCQESNNDIIVTTNKRTQKVNDVLDINFSLYNRILLVDGENCDFSMDLLNSDDLVLMFVAKNTTKNIVFKYQELYDNCFVFISQSVIQDAADHLLTFYAGILSIINKDGNYYVLTKDHYGECLEKFMENCKFICSLDEIIN